MEALFDKIKTIKEVGEIVDGEEILSIPSCTEFQNSEEVVSLLNEIIQNKDKLIPELLKLDSDELKLIINKMLDLVANYGFIDKPELQKQYDNVFKSLYKNDVIAKVIREIFKELTNK
jgi:hypothetical protein